MMFYHGQFDENEFANLFLNGFVIKHFTNSLQYSSNQNVQVSAMVLAAGNRIMFHAPYC